MGDDVGQDVHRLGKVFVQDPGVETGLFLGGEGIQMAADGFQEDGDIPGGAGLGSLEQQVFYQMGQAVLA